MLKKKFFLRDMVRIYIQISCLHIKLSFSYIKPKGLESKDLF